MIFDEISAKSRQAKKRNFYQSTTEYIEQGVKAIQFYIRKYAPECLDVLRGITDGAKSVSSEVSYRDLLILNCRLPRMGAAEFPEEAIDESLEKGCSVCSAWSSATKDGRLIGMDCHDVPGALYQLMIVAFPEDGNPYMCASSAGEWGNHFLMNNKGVFFGNSGGGGSPRDEDFGYGISWSCSLPHVARYANNAVEARDMIMAMQLYEVIHPAPFNPSGLGLRPFGGAWGSWESKFRLSQNRKLTDWLACNIRIL